MAAAVVEVSELISQHPNVAFLGGVRDLTTTADANIFDPALWIPDNGSLAFRVSGDGDFGLRFVSTREMVPVSRLVNIEGATSGVLKANGWYAFAIPVVKNETVNFTTTVTGIVLTLEVFWQKALA